MIGVLVSGTGTNLQALLDAGLPVVAVASNRADAPALARLPASCRPPRSSSPTTPTAPSATPRWPSGCDEHGVRLVVLAGYMHLLTPAFLERFPSAVVNVHPSLLPQFPGAHAVEEQLAAGVSESGATVHYRRRRRRLRPGARAGARRRPARRHAETLHERIKEIEHRLLPRVVEELCAR